MQIKEIAWADSSSQYSLKEQPDGSIELSVDGNVVNFHERQAVETLIEAWSRFESQSREPVERKSNAVASALLSVRSDLHPWALISRKKSEMPFS